MALEGLVIVFSILLAFAIDAWWDQRKEHADGIEQLARVDAELRLDSQMIQTKLRTLQSGIEATSEFISWMGPEPSPQETETITRQLAVAFDIGTFSLVRRAVDDYLAAGRESTPRDAEIRQLLSEWSFHADQLAYQYTILRTEHWTVTDHLNRIPAASALTLTKVNPVMAKHPDSRFPFDPNALLTDPVLESLSATYLIRLEFVVLQLKRQEERQAGLLALIETALAE